MNVCIILLIVSLSAVVTQCLCSPAVEKKLPYQATDGQFQLDLVKVFESDKPLRWSGVKQISELAHESQVVQVHFDTLQEYTSTALNPRSNNGGSQQQHQKESGNKTKQSQDFDTHQIGGSTSSLADLSQQSLATTPMGLPSNALASTTTTTTTTSTTTTTTTTAAPSTTTTEAPTSNSTLISQELATISTPDSLALVGSKTEREGAAVLCGEANANGNSNKRLISDRIVGGYKTEPGEFPFQVRLNIRSRRGSGICGGVVLDRFHILTAAHCMTACVSQHLTTATIENSGVKATIGDHSIKANDGEQELDVETITAHEKYDACNFYANDHDIALIKVSSPIQFRFTTDGYGSINRPCMPESRTQSYNDGEQVIVSGWGVTRENSGALSNILRYVQVPIVNTTKCQETYGSRVTQDHICAGFQVGGKDSCQGDSGGPLVRVVDNRYELVGIVSFGYGCGQPGAPGVYTRVASYIDWIKANLWQFFLLLTRPTLSLYFIY